MIKKILLIFFVVEHFFTCLSSSIVFYNTETENVNGNVNGNLMNNITSEMDDTIIIKGGSCAYSRDDDSEHFGLIQSILLNLSEDDTDDDETEDIKIDVFPKITHVINDAALTLYLGVGIIEDNSHSSVEALQALGKRKLGEENEEPSKKYVRSDHKCRLIKKALAEDLKVLFIQQTGDVFENYYQYDILNYPVDSTKRGTTLNLKEVKMIRNVFDTLEFVKISAERTRSTKFTYHKDFSHEEKYKISKNEVRHIIHERYCKESGDANALHINWSLVDLSQIPDRFSETFEIIKSGRISDYKSIYKCTEILGNIHFFKADAEILARKEVNPLIEARHILLEQYRKDMCLPTANKICWDLVKSISGLDGINCKYFNRSGAREIIYRKDQIKFEPKTRTIEHDDLGFGLGDFEFDAETNIIALDSDSEAASFFTENPGISATTSETSDKYYLSFDDPKDFGLVHKILENLSDTDIDINEESEQFNIYRSHNAPCFINDATLGQIIEENNGHDYEAESSSTTLGKRKVVEECEECEEPSKTKTYFRSDYESRLIKKALADDLKSLFTQQTGDDLKNYYKYEILNYPVDSTKRGTSLTLKELELVRNVFDSLQFVKIPAERLSKKFKFYKGFSHEQKYEISEDEARAVLRERFCKESGDLKALKIDWKLVDLSKIPVKLSETFDIIRSGRIFDYKSIFTITEIVDNIHFFKADAKILARKYANPLIKARHILIEQYRKDMNLPIANKILWDRVKTISGLDGIDYKNLNISGAHEIINRKDQIRFEPDVKLNPIRS